MWDSECFREILNYSKKKVCMNYKEWLAEVPQAITNDMLWRTEVYRQALFLGDLSWYDTRKIVQDRSLMSLADQLYRAAGSISANISEGYSRASGKEQARFYEYALGSAREARDWYFKSRRVIGLTVMHHRLNLLTEIIRQLLVMVPKYRGKYVKEEEFLYETTTSLDLLQNVPMPEPD
jgi:four helix bundle protein